MVSFDEWGHGRFGAVSKDMFEVVQGLLDVHAWDIVQSTVFVSEEVTSEMKLDGSCSFEFELVVVDEGIDQDLCVLANNAEVVNVDGDVFIVVSHVSHLDVSFGLGRKES